MNYIWSCDVQEENSIVLCNVQHTSILSTGWKAKVAFSLLAAPSCLFSLTTQTWSKNSGCIFTFKTWLALKYHSQPLFFVTQAKKCHVRDRTATCNTFVRASWFLQAETLLELPSRVSPSSPSSRRALWGSKFSMGFRVGNERWSKKSPFVLGWKLEWDFFTL